MLKNISGQKKIRVLGVFLIIPAFFSTLFLRDLLQPAPVTSESTPLEISTINETVTQPSESVGVPVHISIPSISVDAEIESVALAEDGSMDVPKDPMNAGWYELGPRPGDIGSAVIAGHLDWYDGQTGSFENLYKMKQGDEIIVRGEEGVEITFVVREIKMYDAEEDATDVFISTDGKAHLNLVTCDGVWNKNARQYSERLVVFAERVVE